MGHAAGRMSIGKVSWRTVLHTVRLFFMTLLPAFIQKYSIF